MDWIITLRNSWEPDCQLHLILTVSVEKKKELYWKMTIQKSKSFHYEKN